MDNSLASLIKSAAGTGAPTNPSSRYYGAATRLYTPQNAASVIYLARRIVPQPSLYASVQNYVVVENDRIDNLSARFLGDPLLFWMICDANVATDSDELTAQKGRSILVPLVSAVPAGARNG